MATNSKPQFFLFSSLLILLPILSSGSLNTVTGHGFSIEEASVHDIQLAFKQNQLTSRQLVEFYLKQIHRLNPILKGVIEVNPEALHLADKADSERKSKAPGSLSGLHGIPILLKDNIATKDKLNTKDGSYALLGSVVPRDAGVVTKLRKAGAIIIGKRVVSIQVVLCTQWLERQRWPRKDPCGSSSGSAISVAANLVAVSLGSETVGSIICPSSSNSVVGIKPTIGLTSRSGVVPISPRQDTIGTISDAVYVLDEIVGLDYNDKATIKASKQEGAILVDNLEIANIDVILNIGNSEMTALIIEFKQALNKYLKELVASPVRTLADAIAFNKKFSDLEKIKEYKQNLFLEAQATNGSSNKEKTALQDMARLTRDGFVKLMIKHNLDALVTPYLGHYGVSVTSVLAIGGFPGISVPAGYDSKGVPFGICFGGLKGSEPKLIEISYGFEQATKIRKPPSFKP
uniref:Amidase domain-containing protein n=1 Tax=Quercus lobata TaxID=97700 RepID=A0A7N2KVP9_QUELO